VQHDGARVGALLRIDFPAALAPSQRPFCRPGRFRKSRAAAGQTGPVLFPEAFAWTPCPTVWGTKIGPPASLAEYLGETWCSAAKT